jgi:hypothetical protein
VLANPLTTRQILADILEEQRGYGQKLIHEGYHEQLMALQYKEGTAEQPA